MLQNEIEAKLALYGVPYLNQNLLTAKAVKRIHIEPTRITLDIELGFPVQGIKATLIRDITALLTPLVENKILDIQVNARIEPHVGKQGVPGLPKVKNIIAVASGKGGVGKSTVAVNLALALAAEGAEVGILDADIYGPSQPAMLGTSGQRPALQDKLLQPIQSHGIQSISIGYLVDQHAPMAWRGPMLGKALQQLLHDTAWNNLDYLIVDLPPGTGDIQLTLCQKIPVSGAIIVTTPQDLALIDVRRACEMFQQLNVPILGVVENMSVYHCTQCGHAERIFGEGGGAKLAKEYQLAELGHIPLDIHIRQMTDSGKPPVVALPDSPYAKAFFEVARHTAATLALQPKDYSAKFPKIVVNSMPDERHPS